MKKYTELLEEVKQKKAVVSMVTGMPTKEHADIIDQNLSLPGEHFIKVSHLHDNSENPVDPEYKISHLKAMYPRHKDSFSLTSPKEPTIFHILADLYKLGHNHVTVVTSDNNKDILQKNMNDENGKFDSKGNGFKFKKINVLSVTENDPDTSETQEKLISSATKGNETAVANLLHHNTNSSGHVKNYIREIRKGLGLTENYEYENLRDSYIREETFKIGDIIKTKSGELAEIISRGSNYVTLVCEGKSPFKSWLTDIELSEGKAVKRDQLYKESYTIKGYRTQNFNRELSEQFSNLSKTIKDSFALYNCVVCLDSLLGLNEQNLSENYRKYKIQFERAQSYLEKIGLLVPDIKHVEDKFIEHVLVTEGYVKFSMQDRVKIAQLIANAVGYSSNSSNPTEIINGAVRKIASMQFSAAGWLTIGKLINIANDSGIPWNKGLISTQLQSRMGLH